MGKLRSRNLAAGRSLTERRRRANAADRARYLRSRPASGLEQGRSMATALRAELRDERLLVRDDLGWPPKLDD
jgi:hypothetical protein